MQVFHFQKFPGNGLAAWNPKLTTKSNAATLAELQASWNRERSLDGAVTHPLRIPFKAAAQIRDIYARHSPKTSSAQASALPGMAAILERPLHGKKMQKPLWLLEHWEFTSATSRGFGLCQIRTSKAQILFWQNQTSQHRRFLHVFLFVIEIESHQTKHSNKKLVPLIHGP